MIATCKKVVIGLIGGTILLIGIAMVILPGPAIVVIPIGLAVLATEFAWARHYLDKFKAKCNAIRGKKGC
jgi:hypothetical protein